MLSWIFGKKKQEAAKPSSPQMNFQGHSTPAAAESDKKNFSADNPSTERQLAGAHLADNDVPGPDALSNFQAELVAIKNNLVKKLDAWEKQRIEIFGEGRSDNPILLQNQQGQINPISQLFKNIWFEIKKWIGPAHQSLHELLTKNAGFHIQELDQHLQSLCEEFKKTAENDAEKVKTIKIEICNTCITVLSELIALTEDFTNEIVYCLKREELGETVARALLMMLSTQIVPTLTRQIDFGFKDQYRIFLNNHIRTDEVDFYFIENETEGTLKKAEGILSGAISAPPPVTSTLASKADIILRDGQLELQKIKTQWFFSPKENVRFAQEKPNQEKIKLKQSNSVPSFCT